ncbi:hypothetical protein Dimus_012378 [Dionaea muscipula]
MSSSTTLSIFTSLLLLILFLLLLHSSPLQGRRMNNDNNTRKMMISSHDDDDDDDDRILYLFSLIPKRHVYIINDLGDEMGLTIHCWSKNDDLGQHYLTYHETFSWHFRCHLFTPTTNFVCDMRWNDVHGLFPVFNQRRDAGRCLKNCSWSIRTDAAYSFNEPDQTWDPLYKWPGREDNA